MAPLTRSVRVRGNAVDRLSILLPELRLIIYDHVTQNRGTASPNLIPGTHCYIFGIPSDENIYTALGNLRLASKLFHREIHARLHLLVPMFL